MLAPWLAGTLILSVLFAVVSGLALGISGIRPGRGASFLFVQGVAVCLMLAAFRGLQVPLGAFALRFHVPLAALAAASILLLGLRLLRYEGEKAVGAPPGDWVFAAMLLWVPFTIATLFLAAVFALPGSWPRACEIGVAAASALSGVAAFLPARRSPTRRPGGPSTALGRFLVMASVPFLGTVLFLPGIPDPEKSAFKPLNLPSPWVMAALAAGSGILGIFGIWVGKRRDLMG